MADRLLVPVPHEHTHAPRSILVQARKLGPDVTEMRAIKHTMELIAHSLVYCKWCCGEGGGGTAGLAKRPCSMGRVWGTKSELHQSPELTDAPMAAHSRAQIADY